jgi:hypothetical protein
LDAQAKASFLSLVARLPLPEVPHGEEGLFESIWLLLTSVITVPLVCMLPGGSPVLGFLVRRAHLLLEHPLICACRLSGKLTGGCPDRGSPGKRDLHLARYWHRHGHRSWLIVVCMGVEGYSSNDRGCSRSFTAWALTADGCLMQAGGALIGPHALGVIKDVEAVRHLAELGVVFLLFNIGLELSLERLRQMQKYVFGLGSTQVTLLFHSLLNLFVL